MTTATTDTPAPPDPERPPRPAPKLPELRTPRKLDVEAEIRRLAEQHGGASRLAEALAKISKETEEESRAELDSMKAKLLAEQVEELQRNKRQALWRRYIAHQPTGYVDASIPSLHPQQDPGGRVTNWWSSGHKNLLLAGPTSKGKSWAAWAVTNALASGVRDGLLAPISVMAMRALDLDQVLSPPDPHAARDERVAANRAAIEHQVRTCDLLLIDDLLVRRPSEWWAQTMYKIFEFRATSSGRTIVTVNATDRTGSGGPVARMEAALGSPVTARLQNGCVPVWIDGDDLRQPVRWDPFGDF